MKSLNCPNRHCRPSGKGDVGAIIRHGFYTTRRSKRRRYQCQTCGKMFSSTTGTAYYRLQHRRATFDGVASLSVEGLNKSAIARVMFKNAITDGLRGERVSICRTDEDNRVLANNVCP